MKLLFWKEDTFIVKYTLEHFQNNRWSLHAFIRQLPEEVISREGEGRHILLQLIKFLVVLGSVIVHVLSSEPWFEKQLILAHDWKCKHSLLRRQGPEGSGCWCFRDGPFPSHAVELCTLPVQLITSYTWSPLPFLLQLWLLQWNPPTPSAIHTLFLQEPVSNLCNHVHFSLWIPIPHPRCITQDLKINFSQSYSLK